MAVIAIGTTDPVQILKYNPRRRHVYIEMQTDDVDANNIGRVHIATGFIPNLTVGHANQGVVLTQGDAIEEPSVGDKIPERWKGNVWALGSEATAQTITVEEDLDALPPAVA